MNIGHFAVKEMLNVHVDPAGVALLCIQELIKENEALKKRIEQLEQKISEKK